MVEFADGTKGIDGFAELLSFELKFVEFVIMLESAELELIDPR